MSQPQAETRFIELMAELFQMDEAEALDFGWYRVIRRHNREVRAFLGEIIAEQGWKVLKGGRLSALLAEAFREAEAEAAAEDRYRLKGLEKDLGLKPGMDAHEREQRLAGLETVPNWRFYKPLHPLTGKPCPHPKSGWKFAYADDEDSPDRRSFVSLEHDCRIAWGEDEAKVPRLKRMLHEVETNVGKSVFRDYSDGEKQTSALFGKSGVFLAPKHADFVSRFILQASKAHDIVLDCFGSSGSTAHAVINTNRLEKSHRKFITVEVNQYFETLIVPRLKKASASSVWSSGKAKTLNGPGLFLRVQTLEQYDDTLANLAIEPETGQSGAFDFDDPAFSLRYRLHHESQALYCAVERFASPFGYILKRVVGSDEASAQSVDLVESLIYLLGLDVTRLYREPLGVIILGHDRREQTVAVFFRDCAHPEAVAWLQAQLAAHPAEQVFTNDPAALAFEGCERFESIEAVFAGQFASLR